ncbi:MAG: hypothetical protein AB7V62_13515 [Thermoleophilia bacterium]
MAEQQTPATKGGDGPGLGRIIAAGAIGLFVVLFALFNLERVEVDWILFERQSRLIYVIIGSAVLGAVADRLLIHRRRRAKKS